ncbi:hypothetical protein F4779DRAFT_623973 [Xylariaceae sp. FL0662B]|nr:hypothetical protein F4779DRAFT_623973 [Xylariaceae sp. FL0662B]
MAQDRNGETYSFWKIFTPDFPNPPSPQQLIRRTIATAYPGEALTNKKGKPLTFSVDNEDAMGTELLNTIKTATSSLDEYVAGLSSSAGMSYKVSYKVAKSYDRVLKQATLTIQKAV